MEYAISRTAVVKIEDLAEDLHIHLRAYLIGELHDLLDNGRYGTFQKYTGLFERDPFTGYRNLRQIICVWCELISNEFFVKNTEIDDVIVEYGDSNKLIQREWVANRNIRREN